MKPFYITTSIVYPNADPHIGYALELVQADFLARYQRLQGDLVYFLSGSDEHGLKIQKAAEAAGLSPQAFVDEKAVVAKRLYEALDISIDRFIRTTDPDHIALVQAMWQACSEDIYKKQYRAWYNVKEEEFLGTADEYPDPAVFGIDPRYIELIDEENYFFRLSRYAEAIKEAINSGRYKVTPNSRWQEVLNQVEKTGWRDISISREKSKLSWGIPVPGDESQVMYVWFDALSNYLTAVTTVDGRGKIECNDFWPANVHVVGKDIHRFHTLIWAGMLMSASIELPEELIVHGFLTSGGQKMSKSTGNVVDPLAVTEAFGQDAVRWYLLSQVPSTGDADFTAERLHQVYNADLANDFGNLVSRVWTMCQKYTGGVVPEISAGEIDGMERVIVDEQWRVYHKAVNERAFEQAAAAAHQLMVYCNKRIDEQKPWQMAKDPAQATALAQLLYELLEIVRHISLMLTPVLPLATSRIANEVFPNLEPAHWQSFASGQNWGLLPAGQLLGETPLILFPKHD